MHQQKMELANEIRAVNQIIGYLKGLRVQLLKKFQPPHVNGRYAIEPVSNITRTDYLEELAAV